MNFDNDNNRIYTIPSDLILESPGPFLPYDRIVSVLKRGDKIEIDRKSNILVLVPNMAIGLLWEYWFKWYRPMLSRGAHRGRLSMAVRHKGFSKVRTIGRDPEKQGWTTTFPLSCKQSRKYDPKTVGKVEQTASRLGLGLAKLRVYEGYVR